MNNIIQLLKGISNPQKYAYEQLNQMAKNNPMIASALQNGNPEDLVRNICKEKGINPDEFYQQIMSQLYKR